MPPKISGKNLNVLPTNPKVVGPRKSTKTKIPNVLKSLGGGTGEPDPQLVPRNSQKGVKQRTSLSVPGVRLR